MLLTIYRNLVPLSFRQFVYDFFLGRILFFIRNFAVIARAKFTYLFGFLLPKNEVNNAFAFIGKNGITSYPADYMLDYKNKDIQVQHDIELNLPYVNHNGKRLYFPETFSVDKVKKDYCALLIEQDSRAAHRYVRSYNELKGKTLLDVGSAEGIFSLDSIEMVDRLILFEYMESWQKPLQATFAKWHDKVTIVPKFVGDKTSGNFVRIDDYLINESLDNLFIKMDIEGAERMALAGAEKTLANGKNIQAAICTYHKVGDPEYLENLFRKFNFSTEFSEGLMYWNKRLSKGVIRCKK